MVLFPFIFTFSNASLQVAMFNLSGSSAYNSLPARCSSRGSPANIRLEGSLLRRAANRLLPPCMCGQRHLLSVRPQEPRGKLVGFPCFAINPGLTLRENRGVPLNFRKDLRKKQKNQPNKQTDHTHHLSLEFSQLIGITNAVYSENPDVWAVLGYDHFLAHAQYFRFPRERKQKWSKI